jgi:hypothetical protein
MPPCLTPESLVLISESALYDFDQRIKQIPSELCTPFNEAASNLEAQLEQSYRFVATLVRTTDDLDLIAQLWQAMVVVCDQFAGKLSQLHAQHPMCAGGYYHDRVLDLRNKCILWGYAGRRSLSQSRPD